MPAADAMTALGQALGCAPPAPPRRAHELPAKLYYRGRRIFTAPPVVRSPLDCTQASTPTERDARDLIERARQARIRFFAGRYSARLHRVVRPVLAEGR